MGKLKPLYSPFDVQYTITVHGITRSDGIPTVTSQMIRDKVISVLEHAMSQAWIRGYDISAMVNNLERAKKIIKRSKKP